MSLQNLKIAVASTMKNMEVIPVRSTRGLVVASDSYNSGYSIDELKDKYFRKSGQDSTVNKREIASDSDDQVDVAIIRKKDSGQDSKKSEERTIIYSDKDGIIGSQG